MGMTHEELLTKISDLGDNCLGIMAGAVMSDALCAVVELHKPAFWNSRETDINEAYCAGCDDRCGCYEGDILSYNKWINCPTIQAIEKVLG